jgi:hypothetical protein
VSWRLLLLGLVAFLVALLVVLPARWVGGLLPPGVQCAEWRGTLWHGSCAQLAVAVPGHPPVMIESTSWKLHPLSLLRGRLSADIALVDARGDATGQVQMTRSGELVLRETSARIQLDPQFSGGLPSGWSGRVEMQQVELDWQANRVKRLGGDFRFSDLKDQNARAVGSYQLVFPLSSTPPFTGQLNDLGGPLAVQASVGLGEDRSWSLNGTVAVRQGGDTSFRRYLEILGAPDAAGRYPLTASGTFK